MKKFFFIAALPRSRTAWLANFLTNGDSMCLHAGLLEVGADFTKLPDVMRRRSSRIVGNSDPSMLADGVMEHLRKEFPEARWVFIFQDPKQSLRRHALAFPEVKGVDQAYIDHLHARLLFFSADFAPSINIHENDLDIPEYCEEVHQFCTGRPMDFERWQVLTKMRVTADKHRWLDSMSPETKAKVACALQ